MFSVHIVGWDYISCVFQLLSGRMVYSLARETFMLHVAWCDRRERRKTERERRWRWKEVESDGVLQAGGVILRHWHKQLLYCKSLEVRLPFIYSRTWFESSNYWKRIPCQAPAVLCYRFHYSWELCNEFTVCNDVFRYKISDVGRYVHKKYWFWVFHYKNTISITIWEKRWQKHFSMS